MLYVKQSHIERVYNETLENGDCWIKRIVSVGATAAIEVSGLPHQGIGVVHGVSRARGCNADRYKYYS